MMLMAPYYTEVPRRSFEAIVKNGWLSEILLALVTDPLEAEDLAERLERGTGESLWVLPAAKGQRRYLAPTSVGDFHKLNIEAKTSWRVTMAQWVMHFKEARSAMKSLTSYDRRIGVWCACQAARKALPFLRNGEPRPLQAIETTESWLRGKATVDQVQKSADAAYSAANDASAFAATYSGADYAAAVSAFYAAQASATSASAAVYFAAATDTAHAADDAINAVAAAYAADGSPVWQKKRDEELVRLREVVANACMTFPM